MNEYSGYRVLMVRIKTIQNVVLIRWKYWNVSYFVNEIYSTSLFYAWQYFLLVESEVKYIT